MMSSTLIRFQFSELIYLFLTQERSLNWLICNLSIGLQHNGTYVVVDVISGRVSRFRDHWLTE